MLQHKNTIPWIEVAPEAPYFMTEKGESWTPIGQNDAITWPDFAGLFKRRNMQQVESHLAWLASHGITVLRLMLEYAQVEHRYLERPVGKFAPNMIQLWDDLFLLCAKYKIRILLTPFDTFWMWRRWKHHPYNFKNGGTCKKRSEWLLCPNTRQAIKNRLSFVAERWGGSGTLFAWDLWNELHPAHAGNRTDTLHEFVQDISLHLRETEHRLYGRSHLQTVSLYGPTLDQHPTLADVIFAHPSLDFASTHIYDNATINNPKNTVSPAVRTGQLVREVLAILPPNRPFLDSEHGPIYLFLNRRKMLPEAFDDEYFRLMQWAHLASGAAGGGMRWPYRYPHQLTHGMRHAQKSMAAFTRLIDWPTFRRRNLNEEVKANVASVAVFSCADKQQALLWLLRTDTLVKNKGMLPPGAVPTSVSLSLPGIAAGQYTVTCWDTFHGREISTASRVHTAAKDMQLGPFDVITDLAIAVRLIEDNFSE